MFDDCDISLPFVRIYMKKDEITTTEQNIDMDNLYKNSVDLIKYARSLASNQVNIIQLNLSLFVCKGR